MYSDIPLFIFHSDLANQQDLRFTRSLLAFAGLPPSIRMNRDNLVTIAIWVGGIKPTFIEHLSKMFETAHVVESVKLISEDW